MNVSYLFDAASKRMITGGAYFYFPSQSSSFGFNSSCMLKHITVIPIVDTAVEISRFYFCRSTFLTANINLQVCNIVFFILQFNRLLSIIYTKICVRLWTRTKLYSFNHQVEVWLYHRDYNTLADIFVTST